MFREPWEWRLEKREKYSRSWERGSAIFYLRSAPWFTLTGRITDPRLRPQNNSRFRSAFRLRLPLLIPATEFPGSSEEGSAFAPDCLTKKQIFGAATQESEHFLKTFPPHSRQKASSPRGKKHQNTNPFGILRLPTPRQYLRHAQPKFLAFLERTPPDAMEPAPNKCRGQTEERLKALRPSLNGGRLRLSW